MFSLFSSILCSWTKTVDNNKNHTSNRAVDCWKTSVKTYNNCVYKAWYNWNIQLIFKLIGELTKISLYTNFISGFVSTNELTVSWVPIFLFLIVIPLCESTFLYSCLLCKKYRNTKLLEIKACMTQNVAFQKKSIPHYRRDWNFLGV